MEIIMEDKKKLCLIHYFTGTGNTYHMVKTLERELQKQDYKVNLINVESSENADIKSPALHIFAFPVYGFGTPAIMLKYTSKLSGLNGSQAVVLCTSAGYEGQALYHLGALLKRKGAKVIYSDMICYTHNWTQVMNPPHKEIEAKVFREAEIQIADLTNQFIGKPGYLKKRNWIGIGIAWIVFLLFSNVARRLLGKLFVADSSCNGCGKCARACPAKAIHMVGHRPKWKTSCESCQRCINLCPQKAIQLSVAKLIIVLIAELAPFFVIAYIPWFSQVSILVNIILFIVMFLINTVIAIYLIELLERIGVFRRIFSISYTKWFRRNIAEGFRL